MWTLRRASIHSIRAQGLRIGAIRTCGVVESSDRHVEGKWSSSEHSRCSVHTWSTSKRSCNCWKIPGCFSIGCHHFSSQVGAKSSGEEEDDSDDGFSELGTPESSVTVKASNLDDDEMSATEVSDVDDNDCEEALESELAADLEGDALEPLPKKKRFSSAIFQAIMENSAKPVPQVLNKCLQDGLEFSQSEISSAMQVFRNRKMFLRALQFSEWLETSKQLEFGERDYASRLDLIAKVRGLQKAESYINSIPEAFRGEVAYRSLLANCVAVNNVKKAEAVFNKMKDLELPLTSFTCNQLLLLYKRMDKKKIADVLLLMEKEDVKPSAFTYRILIDTKGQSNDIAGMDQIVENMKAEGVEPDSLTQAALARHYAAGGLKEKAEAVLKELEGSSLKLNRSVCRLLLPIYADVGNADEVARVWEFCESKPHLDECLAAISAFGKLKKVEEAEAVFDKMSKAWKLSSKHYSALLKVYTDHKMVSKGKDLVKRMGESGCHIGPLAWDALVKLHVEAGEIEKAEAILHKAARQNQGKPMFSSYIAILEQYAKRGDVHNSEKMFHRMRLAGYVARARPFQSLLQAYINAKAPAYGIRERMKADNIFPNKPLAAQLVQVDPFRKTAVSDLLD